MKEIQLLPNGIAFVDDEDFDRVSAYRWYRQLNKASNQNYAVRRSSKKTIYMHREILGLPTGDSLCVDHVDPAATLDNRKANLRVATRSQNRANSRKRRDNTSGFKGVSWDKARKKWFVIIGVNYKQKNLGRFDTLQEAVDVYNNKAKELFGAFARTN